MKTVPPALLPNGFQFVVGDKVYDCPLFTATFISPRIARFHTFDPTITEYRVQTADPRRQFSQFLSLGYGSTVVMTDENRPFLLALARELENTEVHSLILSQIEGALNVDTVCAIGRSDPGFFESLTEKEIEFLASNFWALDWPTRNNIPISILSDILEHPALMIQSEEWLYLFIVSKLDAGRKYFKLFRFVRFDLLNWTMCRAEIIWHFLQLAREYPEYVGDVLDLLWSDLIATVGGPWWAPKQPRPSRPDSYVSSCWHCGPQKEEGSISIFRSLKAKISEGNLHDHGIVTVTAKSNSGDDWSEIRKILDDSSKTCFQSADEPNQWICCDFHDRRVSLSEVVIESERQFPGQILAEGSIDGDTWTRIPFSPGIRRSPCFLKYRVPVASDERYRFVRLIQSAPNSDGNDTLTIHLLHLFGALFERDQ
jgi:hypothetical protein